MIAFLALVILSIDIFDKEQSELRKIRWSKAFAETSLGDRESNALRATVVLEHIIQASDVSHVMQHWVSLSPYLTVQPFNLS